MYFIIEINFGNFIIEIILFKIEELLNSRRGTKILVFFFRGITLREIRFFDEPISRSWIPRRIFLEKLPPRGRKYLTFFT